MSKPPAVHMLIADDHYVVRMGLSAVLEYDPVLKVAAMAEDGGAAVDLFRKHRPDVTLMDVRMPVLDGIEATRRILALDPAARVLMLSTLGGDRDVRDALAAGAKGYVLKTAGLEDLRAAVRAAMGGETWLSDELRRPAPAAEPTPALSPRQREVLDLLGKGLSNKEIARALGFTADGTKAHLKAIYAKLGVQDRTEAVVAAIRLGFVRVPT